MESTIIYYTANVEDYKFEQKIIDNLKKQAVDIPIISVSRKSIDLGRNICIGEKPVCYSNSFKQLLIGLKEAKTKFCIAAESDVLYPPEYFGFIPLDKNNVYRYTNVWVFWKRKRAFWNKSFSEGAQMCGREYWIERIESALKGYEGWEPMENPKAIANSIFTTGDKYSWQGNPVITFKTGQGLCNKTGCNMNSKTESLPYWGNAESISGRMFNETN